MIRILSLVFIALASAVAIAQDDYSSRNQQLENQKWQQRAADEKARTLQDNQRMLDAAATFAAAKGASVNQSSLNCPVRKQVYWEGWDTLSDDPWLALRYQYCEFKTTGDDACNIGMNFAYPVYVFCIQGGVKKGYRVTAGGGVEAVNGDGAPVSPGRVHRHKRLR